MLYRADEGAAVRRRSEASLTSGPLQALAIRTAVLKDGELHVQAGGGIVADSDPDDEWHETLNKRRALFRAVAMAEKGLDNLE